MALRPNASHGPPHFWGSLITHNDAPQSVGLLWTGDQLVAETSTWQHITLTKTNIHAPGGIRTHDLSKRAAADLHLRPRGYWGRHYYLVNLLLFPKPIIIITEWYLIISALKFDANTVKASDLNNVLASTIRLQTCDPAFRCASFGNQCAVDLTRPRIWALRPLCSFVTVHRF